MAARKKGHVAPWEVEDKPKARKKRAAKKKVAKKAAAIDPKALRANGSGRKTTMFQREIFVRHYVKTFNGTEAAVVAGYGNTRKTAASKASKLLHDPEIVERIHEYLDELDADVFVSREVVMKKLMEQAMYYGVDSSHTARVAALTTLAKITGAMLPKGKDDDEEIPSVMVVPTLDPGSWEKAAMAQQAQLKLAAQQGQVIDHDEDA